MYGSGARGDYVPIQVETVVNAVRAAARALDQLAAGLDTDPETDPRGHHDPWPGWEALREENRQLREALDSRAVIERAKGVLMARHDCSEQDAFKLLATAARRQQRKVRLVADDLLDGVWAAELPATVV
jgi:hypothetical protein